MGCRPFDDIVSIRFFIAVGLELTVGGVSASNVDEKDEITAVGGLDGELGFSGVVFLAIGGSIDDRWKSPGCVGAEQRRSQPDAIAQRDLDAPLYDDIRIRLVYNQNWLRRFRSGYFLC
jgi:hypothetical protein